MDNQDATETQEKKKKQRLKNNKYKKSLNDAKTVVMHHSQFRNLPIFFATKQQILRPICRQPNGVPEQFNTNTIHKKKQLRTTKRRNEGSIIELQSFTVPDKRINRARAYLINCNKPEIERIYKRENL